MCFKYRIISEIFLFIAYLSFVMYANYTSICKTSGSSSYSVNPIVYFMNVLSGKTLCIAVQNMFTAEIESP